MSAIECSVTALAERAVCGHSIGLGRVEHSCDGMARGTVSLFGSSDGDCSFEVTPILVAKVLSGEYDENAIHECTEESYGLDVVVESCDCISESHSCVEETVCDWGTTSVDIKPEPGCCFDGISASVDEASMFDLLCPRDVVVRMFGCLALSPDK